jgi:hypothetical protein
MEILTLADLGSGLVGATNDYIHENRSQALKTAAFNVVASIVGRWVTNYFSSVLLDKFFKPELKNYLVIFLTRFIIAKVMREKHCVAKSMDTVLCDAFAVELARILSGSGEYTLLGPFSSLTSQTGPVAGANVTL